MQQFFSYSDALDENCVVLRFPPPSQKNYPEIEATESLIQPNGEELHLC